MAIKIISTTCPEANIINSGSTYSDSAPAGHTFILPNVTNIDSDGSSVLTPAQVGFTASTCDPATIINSGSTYTASTAAGTTFILPNVTNIDSDGSSVLTPAIVGFTASTCDPATIINSGSTYTASTAAGATFELPNVVNIDSDGSSVLTPAIVGFTASTAGATVVLTVSDSTPNFGDTVTLTVTSTGMTPSSYRFWIPQEDNTYRIVTQATNTYSWKVDIYGAWTVRGGANTLGASAYDIDGVDIMSRHVVPPYVRPSDWISIPSINVGGGEEVSYCLMQVFDTAHNYIAVTCEGDFTVDWGDGSTPVNYASGTQAENDIAYSGVSNLSTRGYRQALVKITPQAGQNLTLVNYGVRHSSWGTNLISSQILEIDQHLPNATTFKVYHTNQVHYYLEQFNWRGNHNVTSYSSLFRNGYRLQSVVALPFTNSSLNCYRVFYNARLLRIFPTINITSCTNAAEMFYGTGIEWVGDVTITGTVTSYTSLFRACSKLLGVESLTINTSTSAVINLLYHTCSTLRYVPLFVYNGTNVSSMHESNNLLQYIPPYDFPNITTLSSFAKSCFQLRKPCKFASSGTTANVTSLYRAYQSCESMLTAMRSGEHDFSLVTTARECYSGCISMKFSHNIDLPICTNFTSFQASARFEEIDVFDTSSGQDFNYFVSGSVLKTFPLFDTSSATSFFAFFQSNYFLESVADLDTSNVTTFQQTFYQCYALCQLPNWDFSSATNFYRFGYSSRISRFNITPTTAPTNLKEVFRSAFFLQQIDNFDWSAVTDTTNGFVNLYNLRRVIGCECPVNISFSNASALQAAEIDEIFTDLPTVVGKTITVTGTAGASTCTPSIAQAKGWAVSN